MNGLRKYIDGSEPLISKYYRWQVSFCKLVNQIIIKSIFRKEKTELSWLDHESSKIDWPFEVLKDAHEKGMLNKLRDHLLFLNEQQRCWKKSGIIFSRLCCDSCIVCVIAHIRRSREIYFVWHCPRSTTYTHQELSAPWPYACYYSPFQQLSHESSVVVLNMALMCSRVHWLLRRRRRNNHIIITLLSLS